MLDKDALEQCLGGKERERRWSCETKQSAFGVSGTATPASECWQSSGSHILCDVCSSHTRLHIGYVHCRRLYSTEVSSLSSQRSHLCCAEAERGSCQSHCPRAVLQLLGPVTFLSLCSSRVGAVSMVARHVARRMFATASGTVSPVSHAVSSATASTSETSTRAAARAATSTTTTAAAATSLIKNVTGFGKSSAPSSKSTVIPFDQLPAKVSPHSSCWHRSVKAAGTVCG